MTHADSLRLALRTAGKRDRQAKELAKSMARVDPFLDEWWRTNHQPWFTDHGVRHSRTVAELSLQIASLMDPHVSRPLNLLERYALWAASMLHDVGMQMLQHTQKPLDSMSSSDLNQVRHEHPFQSGLKISSEPVQCGLPDDPSLAEVIGSIARAHGTKYYRETVQTLEEVAYARGGEIRARLLSAIVLLADELDLEYGRARPPSGQVVMPVVSTAHMFKHQCVDRVQLDVDNAGRLRITLQLTFNDSLPVDDQQIVERWIVDKLQQQIGMVERELVEGLQRREPISRAIRRVVRTASNRVIPPQNALDVIAKEVSLSALLNHRAAYKSAMDEAARGSVVTIIGKLSADFLDQHGREDLLDAVVQAMQADMSATVWRADVALINLGASSEDILTGWLNAAGGAIPGGPSRVQLLDRLIDCVRGTEAGVLILVAPNIDALKEVERDWLAQTAIPNLQAAKAGCRFVFSAGSAGGILSAAESSTAIAAESPLDQEVTEYLSRVMPHDVAESIPARELTYAHHRRLYQRRQLTLLEEAR